MTIVHGQIAIAVLQVASLGDTEGVRFAVMTSPMGGLLHKGVRVHNCNILLVTYRAVCIIAV